MDYKRLPNISIIITTYNDNDYLDIILRDISKQKYPKNKIELLLLEAGDYSKKRALANLGSSKLTLKYFHIPKFPRTKALNKLVSETKNNIVVRLDARSHINQNYLKDVVELSIAQKVANVGGFQNPVGLNDSQKFIANIMKHPICFGGAKHRNRNFKGYVDSVYLGVFNKKLMPPEPWFDEDLVKISEDSDLNFRIRKNGGYVYLSSDIKVDHYPRENLRKFYTLCYNYGFGRGLFYYKHKTFSAPRQLVLPLAGILIAAFLFLSFFNIIFLYFLYLLIVAYLFIIFSSSLMFSYINRNKLLKIFVCFFLAHVGWTLGFYKSLWDNIILKNKPF